MTSRYWCWQIEQTNACNYRCVGCARTHAMTREIGFMADDVWGVCAEWLGKNWTRGQQMPELHGFGDSLLHPQIAQRVEDLTRRSVFCSLSCRPEQLTPGKARDLFSARLHTLVVALDACTQETLTACVGAAGNLELATQHIADASRINAELGYPTQLVIQRVRSAGNAHEEDAWQRWCGEHLRGPWTIRMKRFDAFALPRLREQAAPGFLDERKCDLPPQSFSVLWDGRIVPCCHDVDGEVMLGHVFDTFADYEQDAVDMGDVLRKHKIDAALNLNEACAFRWRWQEGTLPEGHLCRRCAWYGR